MASPAKTVAARFRGTEVTLIMPYKYDGADNDMEFIFYDDTNAAIIPSSTFKEISTPIGNCTIKNINIFRNQGDYVEVEYTYTNSQGKVSTRTSWLAPSQLKAIEQPETTE